MSRHVVPMRNVLFTNGRLAWPPVILVMYVAATDLTLDVIWRTVSLPFESLLIWGGLIFVAGLSLLLLLFRLDGARTRADL